MGSGGGVSCSSVFEGDASEFAIVGKGWVVVLETCCDGNNGCCGTEDGGIMIRGGDSGSEFRKNRGRERMRERRREKELWRNKDMVDMGARDVSCRW